MKEITVKVTNEKEESIINEFISHKNFLNYLGYLLELDKVVNGTDTGVLDSYMINDGFISKHKDDTEEEIDSLEDSLLQDAAYYLEEVFEEIPLENRMGFIEEDGSMITLPEDANVAKAYYAIKNLIILKSMRKETK